MNKSSLCNILSKLISILREDRLKYEKTSVPAKLFRETVNDVRMHIMELKRYLKG